MQFTTTLDRRMLNRHRFAIVAAESMAELPKGIEGRRIVHKRLSDSAELMPSVVELDRLDVLGRDALLDTIDASEASGQRPVVSALLESPVSVERVVLHLARSQVRAGPGGVHAWMRIHDPRVWLHFFRVLGESDLRALFGPITGWTVWLAGHWITTSPSDGAAHPRERELDSVQQWAALHRVGAVNRVLANRGWSTHDGLSRHASAIDALIVRGSTRHGLERLSDLVDYATLGVAIHPRFDETSVAVQAVAAHRTHAAGGDQADASVVDALLAIPADAWARASTEFDDLPAEPTR